MELVFTKRGGTYDELVVRRPGRSDTPIACPRQGIIPHDMVHHAVESVVATPGFLSLMKNGSVAGFAAQGGDDEEAVERLVETFQAELWGERVPVDELVATYEHACAARGHATAPITPGAVEAIRARLDDLTARWSALGVGEALALRF